MNIDLRYPIWTLLDTEAFTQQFPQGVVPITRRDAGRAMTAMMVFGSPELAAKFIEAIQKPKLAPVALQFPQQVIDALDHCQKAGATHVVIDFEFVAPGERSKGTAALLGDFRRSLHTNIPMPTPSSN